MKKIIIAIDGYSSTGKSTLAKALAKKLHYLYIDSGAMYRAITWYALEDNCYENDRLNVPRLLQQLNDISITFRWNSTHGKEEILLNNENISEYIRIMNVAQRVSEIAAIPEVREKLVNIQQSYGDEKGIVMDGRDIGTVVFPNAELKIFMTASHEIRAERRWNELQTKGDTATYETVADNLIQRDLIDTTREDSPLVKANDAIEIDNSNMTPDEQFDLVYQMAMKKINNQ